MDPRSWGRFLMLVNYHPPLLHSISTLFGWVDGQRRNAQLLSSILCLSISTNCMLRQANLAMLIISVLSDGSFQHPGGSNLERKNWICYWSGPSSSINLYKHALPLCYWIMPMFSHAVEYQHVCFSILLFLQILSSFKLIFISFYHILYFDNGAVDILSFLLCSTEISASGVTSC